MSTFGDIVFGIPAIQKAASQGQQIVANATTPQQPKEKSWAEMIGEIMPHQTPEEKQADLKRQRRQGLFSAIGDGISSLANLYFTSQGAVNAYDPTQSMSAKTQARWDKYNKERKAEEDAYNQALIRAKMQDAEDAYKARRDKQAQDNWERQFKQTQDNADRSYKFQVDNAAQAQENWEKQFKQTQDNADRTQENWEKSFGLQKASTNASVALTNAKIKEAQKENTTQFVGRNDIYDIPREKLQDSVIRRLFNELPREYRSQLRGAPILNPTTGQPDRRNPQYAPLTVEDMFIAVGSWLQSEGTLPENSSTADYIEKVLNDLSGGRKLPLPQRQTGTPAVTPAVTPTGQTTKKPSSSMWDNQQ